MQLRGSPGPWLSQVPDDAVMSTRTNSVAIGVGASASVTVPPIPPVTTPPGNACHVPCAGS